MEEKRELVLNVTNRLLKTLGGLFAFCILFFVIFLLLGRTTIPVVVLVMSMGLFGGFISIQRRLKKLGCDDLRLMANSWAYIFLAPFSGSVLAVILYCLFISKMVQGGLFPEFEAGDGSSPADLTRLFNCHAKDYTDYAKLVVWSFLAGFSESLVTNVLGNFVSTATDSQNRVEQRAGTDRGSDASGRSHAAFLNSYAPEDEGLYDAYPGR